MRLLEIEIQEAKEMADYIDENPYFAELTEHTLIHIVEDMVVIKGVDETLKLMEKVISAFRHHQEHGDMLHNAFLGFRELMEVETI